MQKILVILQLYWNPITLVLNWKVLRQAFRWYHDCLNPSTFGRVTSISLFEIFSKCLHTFKGYWCSQRGQLKALILPGRRCRVQIGNNWQWLETSLRLCVSWFPLPHQTPAMKSGYRYWHEEPTKLNHNVALCLWAFVTEFSIFIRLFCPKIV
jgi:hypothetical protein